MSEAMHPRPRVLIADFEPMVQLGMGRVLAEGGVDVLPRDEHTGSIVAHAARDRPDAVVLGLDERFPPELPAAVRDAAPGAKVIVWARDETEMQVFDPGTAVPRWIRPAARDALLREIVPTAVAVHEE